MTERASRRDDRRHGHSSRRHRSPSYDSYSDSGDSYSSDTSEEFTPRRPSRSKTTAVTPQKSRQRSRNRDAYSDSEDRYYSKRRSYSRSPSPERRERKGIVEDVLGAFGLLFEKQRGDRDRRDGTVSTHDHAGSRHVSSRGDDPDRKKKQMQALQAAITAAAVEAYRSRKEPGGFTAQKLMRIAGAAIAAGGLDAIVDKNPNSGSLRHIAEAVVGGLATSKTVGPSIRHRREGGMKGRARDGLVAAAAGKIAERHLTGGSGGSSSRHHERGESSRRARSFTPPKRSTTGALGDILKGVIVGR